jgi:sugar/nucleoside kinase (ribokinase family)
MENMTCLVLGDINIDFDLHTPQYPPEGGRTHAIRTDFQIGGSGCLTAVSLSRLGCGTALAGNLGNDMPADWSLQQIHLAGVDSRFVRRVEAQPTGFFMIVSTPGGKPTTFGCRGANTLPLPEEKIIDGLTAFRHLHISGYTLIGDDQFEAVKRILLSAKQTGLTVSLDPGVCSSEQSREKILSMLIHVDYFLPDLAELAQLTGDLPLDDQLEALLERGCRAVALKMGEHGSRYIDADQAVQQPAVRREGARIISTNGAGDCFNAGFIAAILAGRSPKEALQAGNREAFRRITRADSVVD